MENTEKNYLVDTLTIPILQGESLVRVNADEQNRARLKEARDLLILITEKVTSGDTSMIEKFPLYIQKVIRKIVSTGKIDWIDHEENSITLSMDEIDYILLSAMAFQYKLFVNPKTEEEIPTEEEIT